MHLSTCSFIHPFIHPFVHSSIRSFTQSFIHSFMLLVIYSFIHSSIHSLLLLSFIDLFLFVTPVLNRCMNQAWRDVRTTWIVRPTVLCRTLNWICDTLHKSCTIHRPDKQNLHHVVHVLTGPRCNIYRRDSRFTWPMRMNSHAGTRQTEKTRKQASNQTHTHTHTHTTDHQPDHPPHHLAALLVSLRCPYCYDADLRPLWTLYMSRRSAGAVWCDTDCKCKC